MQAPTENEPINQEPATEIEGRNISERDISRDDTQRSNLVLTTISTSIDVNNKDTKRNDLSISKEYEGNCVIAMFHRIVPDGGVISGAFNLAGSSLGAGILGIPSAFHNTGLIMGTFYLFIIYALTVFSLRLLALTSLKTGVKSYEGLGQRLFGKGGDFVVAGVMFFKCLGACIAYVVCIGDIWSSFLKDERVKGYYRTNSFRRLLVFFTFVIFMLPLSLPKRINSLRFISLASVFGIIYFLMCITAHSATHGLKSSMEEKNIKLWGTGNAAMQGMAKFMFAYLCQSNMFEVWNEMRPAPSVKRMEKEVAYGMFACSMLYWLCGFFAYMNFGEEVTGSLITMHSPLKDYYFLPAYVFLLLKLCVAFALHILPCRDSAHHILGWQLVSVNWWKNAALCSVLSLLSLLCGLFIPDVNIVFSLLGSLTGSLIGFVFPSLFFMYAGGFNTKNVPWYDYSGTYVLLICGVVVICFGTTSTIFSMF